MVKVCLLTLGQYGLTKTKVDAMHTASESEPQPQRNRLTAKSSPQKSGRGRIASTKGIKGLEEN